MKMKQDNQQFYLDIKYSQNNTWQGSVQRLDTGEKVNFRSALELLNLLEQVVAESSTEEEKNARYREWQSTKEVDSFLVGNGTTGR